MGKARAGTAIALTGLVTITAVAAVERIPASAGTASGGPPRPNVVLLLTDDQTREEMVAMPRTRRLIGRHGVSFARNYISFPLCCPSRVTFLTGRYMHNHGVHGNRGRLGGRRRFHALHGEDETLAVWLHRAGYHTIFLGKYLNGYPPRHPNVPPGWDEWHGKTSQYNPRFPGYRIYYDYALYERAGPTSKPRLVHYGASPRAYETDVLRRKSVRAISRATRGPSSGPFYMTVNFSAPHAPFVPAPRHRGLYRGKKLPKLEAFDERDLSDKPRFLRRQARGPIPAAEIRITRRARRRQLEQLRSVDQAVAAIVRTLRRRGLLRNTYIVFSSDNGTFWGEHRISEGKYLPYDPATRVPLLVRGPGVKRGAVSRELVANVDYAPTILQITGASAPARFAIDGRSMLPFLERPGRRTTRPILLEADKGPGFQIGDCPVGSCKSLSRAAKGVRNLDQEPAAQTATATVTKAPAYRAIRTSRYLFVRYSTGDTELYDMKLDPQQLRSRHRSPRYRRVRRRLSRLLGKLASCRGAACARSVGRIGGP